MKLLLTTTLAAAAVFRATASNSPLRQLSTQDVQALLAEWRLDAAYGESFLADQVDGVALFHMSADDLSAYPQAKSFHARKLLDRRDSLVESLAASVPAQPRRRLSTTSSSGIAIDSVRSDM